MMRNKFLVTILTHGRPDKVITYSTLRRCGYTGNILLILDNEDKTVEDYRKTYRKDEIYVFDKGKEAELTDACDNFQHHKAAVYARNASYRIVQELGYRYFIQLDDDYTGFYYRMGKNYEFIEKSIKNLDAIFDMLLDFYIQSQAESIAIAQDGELLGGSQNNIIKNGWKIKRKCMNSWICDVDKPLRFTGHLNDDCTCYTLGGRMGKLFMQINMLSLKQAPTQSVGGGMTDIYKQSGTYLKTMYTIMQAPSCTKMKILGLVYPRIHHHINYKHCTSKIIREEWKKR